MEQSILISTKKILGIAADYVAFDLDIITHINAAFSTLTQLGVGPATGFMIEDDKTEWEEYIESEAKIGQLNTVKSYVFLKVRQLFDPPTTSYLITAMEKQIQELEWRLNVSRETTAWVYPTSTIVEPVRDLGLDVDPAI
jgi:hypothetical protein